MDPSWWPFIILGALAISAFSSGMEIAYITANKLKVELDRKQGVFGSSLVAWFMQRPKMFIATMLVGNNIGLVIYGYYSGELIIAGLQSLLSGTGYALTGTGLLLTQTVVSTIVVLIAGEYIPKAIFSINPNRWLNYFAPVLVIWYGLMWVFAWLVSGISTALIRVFTGKQVADEELSFGRIDLDHYLQEATGFIDPKKDIDLEIQIFQNALDFSKVKARDCLVPRTELVAVDIQDPIGLLKQKFIETRLSKILVYKQSIDHIIGYVHSYELFKKPTSIQSILRPAIIIPEPMPASEILELFIKQKRHMAVVVDEFGGTAGILTMEDIVEEIFGEIEDEHDKEDLTERVISEWEYEFSARLEVNHLNSRYTLNLPVNENEYDTLGGLMLHLFGDIPEQGQTLEHKEYQFTVTRVSEKRVEMVHIRVNQ